MIRVLFAFILCFTTMKVVICKENKNNNSNYLSIRSPLPISLLEVESIISLGLQLKYNKIGIELEHGQILKYTNYSQDKPDFNAKLKGQRTRLYLKYFFFDKPKSNGISFHHYVSLMPSYKNVTYKMVRWSYDSIDINNMHHYKESNNPIKFKTKSLSLNLLFGSEFYLSSFNVDYYIGIGRKFFDINIPNSISPYFEPISPLTKDGNYLNILLGAKIGFAYKIKKK